MATIQEKINELLTEHGYPVRENDRSFITTCPQCGKERHLYVYKETGLSKCMKCGTGFSPEALVVALTGCTWPDAKKILWAGTPVEANKELTPFQRLNTSIVFKKEPLKAFNLPSDFFMIASDLSTRGMDYLAERGVGQEIMFDYDLRFCPSLNRVIFPVYMNGDCVGWQGRDVTGTHELRYMSPPGFSKSRVLLGWDLLTEDKDYVILTEGPIDSLKTAVLKNSLCSLGKNISNEQINLIQELSWVKKVYLAFDPDAFMLFDKIAQALEPDKEVYIMQPPNDKKDFGECDTNEVLRGWIDAKRYGKANSLPTGIFK